MTTLYVDFNEMPESDLVLLSSQDSKMAINGEAVLLKEGAEVTVYMDDIDENGGVDSLVATGIIERNSNQAWGAHVKWCCRINADGIRHQSEFDPDSLGAECGFKT